MLGRCPLDADSNGGTAGHPSPPGDLGDKRRADGPFRQRTFDLRVGRAGSASSSMPGVLDHQAETAELPAQVRAPIPASRNEAGSVSGRSRGSPSWRRWPRVRVETAPGGGLPEVLVE